MTEVQLREQVQALLAQILELGHQIEVLAAENLELNKKASIAQALAEGVAKHAIEDAKTAETMALLAAVAAKSCHLQARSQNNVDLIALTQKADQAAKKVYDFAIDLAQNNSKNLAEVNLIIHKDYL